MGVELPLEGEPDLLCVPDDAVPCLLCTQVAGGDPHIIPRYSLAREFDWIDD